MKRGIWRDRIHQMMGNALHFFWSDLGCSDIHLLVDLHGIGRDDLSSYCLRQLDRGSSLSHRCGTSEDDEWFFIHCYTILLNFFSNSFLVMDIVVGLPWGQ